MSTPAALLHVPKAEPKASRRSCAPPSFERRPRRAQDSAHPGDPRVPEKERAGYAPLPAARSGASGAPARGRR